MIIVEVFLFSSQLTAKKVGRAQLAEEKKLFKTLEFLNVYISLISVQQRLLPVQISPFKKKKYVVRCSSLIGSLEYDE